MRPLLLILGAATLGALAMLAPAYGTHGAASTYAGRVVTGGSLSFKVAANGRAITRISLKNVGTDCGTITSTTTGKIPIVKQAFSYSGGGLKFKGSFPAKNKARGTVSYSTAYPSCKSPAARWTATKR